ncbi:MAG: NAD(P)-dependent oxidoreductase [Ignavibacteriales bacterium]|nr:NAD(P)-dependent oxidoreductase [Ignavibacteriales bacterium]
MQNIAPKLTHEQYEKNFAEIKPALSPAAAIAEANRCLYCYDSPCTKACPTHIDIPAFIKKIATRNMKGSAKTILESNWVALTCAKACPVAVLCEGACVFNAKSEPPIEIGLLQRYAMDEYFSSGMPALFTKAPAAGKSVGIIGSGPAGLACAAELALHGVEAIIYEAKDIPGGLDTWGIAPYKVRKEDSLKEVGLIESLGVTIKTGIKIGTNLQVDELLSKHDALFLGIGLGESHELAIEGENTPGVIGALQFIADVKREDWQNVVVGKRVAVIGAGNTAIDAATEARRLGAEQVLIVYRRSQHEMPAYGFEFDLAKTDGVQFYFLSAPVKVLGTESVTGLKCIKMELGEPDKQGRRSPKPVPGSEFILELDMVIKSIGQQTNAAFLQQLQDVVIESGKVVVDDVTYQTGNPKIFAGGDCINGGKEVVNAAYDGKRAALGIIQFLLG